MEKDTDGNNRLYRTAFCFAIITIVYNTLEGIISTYLGYKDESLALFGFGVDRFAKALSGLGIVYMIRRLKRKPNSKQGNFERTIIKITGISFYILAIGLIITSLYNILTKHMPHSTFWGVLISAVSILMMWVFMIGKGTIGEKLNSDAIIADAECTQVCIYMSLVLLISSGIYEVFHIEYIDSLGALALAYFAYMEGKECLDKGKSNSKSPTP